MSRTLSTTRFVVATLVASLLLSGCGSKPEAAAKPKGKGYIRFVNLTGEQLEWNNGKGNARPQIEHGEISPRQWAPAGPVTLKFQKDKKDLYSENVEVQPDVVYTMYAFLGKSGPSYKVIENDPQRCEEKGSIIVRLLNLAEGQTASASTAGGLETPIGDAVAAFEASSDVKLGAGMQSLQVKAGGKTIKVPDFMTASGEAYTIVLFNKKGGGLEAMAIRNSSSMQIGTVAPTAG